jgi:hypothetical protein
MAYAVALAVAVAASADAAARCQFSFYPLFPLTLARVDDRQRSSLDFFVYLFSLVDVLQFLNQNETFQVATLLHACSPIF